MKCGMSMMKQILHEILPREEKHKKVMVHCVNDENKICPRSYINNKLILVIGKSGAGKDMYTRNIIQCNQEEIDTDGCPCKKIIFSTVKQYTSRPQRANEVDGKDYIFLKNQNDIDEILADGSIFDIRKYSTLLPDSHINTWYYAIDTKSINLSQSSYIIVGPSTSPLKWVEKYITHFGSNHIILLYIDTPDMDVFENSLNREQKKDEKGRNYSELCRRYLDNVAEYEYFDSKLNTFTSKFKIPVLHINNTKANPEELMERFSDTYDRLINFIIE